jgi:D-proline reductase (dithiol) PrdB
MIEELRARIRAQYKPDFDFTIVGQVPFTAASKPVASSRIALISTAGLYLDDQKPFDRTTPTGDCSYRRVRADDDLSRLRIHWDVDHQQPASQDLNCAFPLALLRELEQNREIGSVASMHYSFSGAIPDPRGILDHTAPAVAHELRADAVDAVLVAPS